ncbi:MAG: LamG-like jellyroll fold domain-containing protein [Phycisphaerae bacterium]|jgi:hypothetical protein
MKKMSAMHRQEGRLFVSGNLTGTECTSSVDFLLSSSISGRAILPVQPSRRGFIPVVRLALASMVVSLIFGSNHSLFGDNAQLENKLQEGVTFCLDFNSDSVIASKSSGDGSALRGREPEGISYVTGVKGKSLESGDKGIELSYKFADNLSMENPGSVSIWIKPIEWKYAQDMPEGDNGHREVICPLFFGTGYQRNGYLGFERMSSHKVDGKDTLLLFFGGFDGINANAGTPIAWTGGRWHNVVITWDPLEYKIYIDGEFQRSTVIQRKIQDAEVAQKFSVNCPSRTAIDEFMIYNRVLTAEEVTKYYEYENPEHSEATTKPSDHN